MKYKIISLFLILVSCTTNYSSSNFKKSFNSKGFAYIYNEEDFSKKIITKKLDNSLYQVAHNKLKPGSLIKIINTKTKDTIILKNDKRIKYPDFYKILITKPVANKINLNENMPFVEIIELRKNKSFVAQKSKIFKEEKKIPNKAPVETVEINNISKKINTNKKKTKDKFYIIIGEFYSINAAKLLKKRIIDELVNLDRKKLYIKSKESNKIRVLAGPYNSINLVKNDYILLKNFGFEELNISINE